MASRSFFRYILIGCVLTLPILLGLFAFSKKDMLKKRSFQRKNISLDELKFYKKNGTEFDLRSFSGNGKTTVLIVFSKECDLCRMEIKKISDHFEKFANSNVLFIGTNDDATYRFLKQEPFNLLEKKNVKLVHDNEGLLYRKLKIISTPTILVFDKSGKIDNIYEGSHQVKSIFL